MEQARELYRRVRSAPPGFRLEALLAEMKVKLDVQPADLERIPIKGPLLAVANHPFGVLDGAALAVLLLRVRPDVKILTPICTSIASSWTHFTLRLRRTRM